jgi:hypothetical protein
LRADHDRAVEDLFLAALCACRRSAERDAAEWPSRRSAFETARERVRDFGVLRRPRASARLAFVRVRALAFPLRGAGSFTPARRAFDRPIAIACFVLRAPCFPSRTCSISSWTNSPACVLGAFPSRSSSRARSIVVLLGMIPPYSFLRCKTRSGAKRRPAD